VDRPGGDGRVEAEPDREVAIDFANNKIMYDKRTYIAKCLTEAHYLINLAVLRGHNLAGVTMNAKNHFGSIWVPWEGHWNKGWTPDAEDPLRGLHGDILPFYSDWLKKPGLPMGSYNVLVELMGHKDLGGKTMLFLIDGLYPAHDQGKALPVRWQTPPFNNHWASSLFASQDGVAIESVGLDFLRAEPSNYDVVQGTVDNYLHEAALANNPPSGTFYDPEGDGTRLESPGAHEHWNNARDKQYSRNLGTGEGIELKALGGPPKD